VPHCCQIADVHAWHFNNGWKGNDGTKDDSGGTGNCTADMIMMWWMLSAATKKN